MCEELAFPQFRGLRQQPQRGPPDLLAQEQGNLQEERIETFA
jgi:hypothetical protein